MNARLRHGDSAPDFSGYDLLDQPARLGDYRGRWLLLSFYRYASCPLCNLRVHDLSRRHTAWQTQGMEMLAVFQSPPDKLRQYVGRQLTPFPLMPDPQQRLYTQYGVRHSWAGFLKAWLMRLPEIGKSVFAQGFLPGTVDAASTASQPIF